MTPLTPESFTEDMVAEEVNKLQYLFSLKREIRYAQSREDHDVTESVADHIYGMHILALYFLPLEDPESTWDRTRIYEMITVHDIDEIETGDMLGYAKTDAIRKAEAVAMRNVINRSPLHMQDNLSLSADEYEAQSSFESQFVKAIDKFEPVIYLYTEEGREVIKRNKTTADQSSRIKYPYINNFPFINRFTRVMHERMIKENYFWTD